MIMGNVFKATKDELRTEIENLYNEFYNEVCPEIVAECEAEGYPGGGVNYDLRCTAAWERYYKDEIGFLTAILEDKEWEDEHEEDEVLAHGEWVNLDGIPEEFAEDAED